MTTLDTPIATVTTTVEQITPDLAMEWLGHNVNNRGIRQQRVRTLAADIRAGHWRLTHQGIAFDRRGRLVDGQHRLLAVIEADQPITCLVTRGVDPGTFEVIDTGAARTIGDALTLRGETQARNLGAALAWKWRYDNDLVLAIGREAPTHEQLLSTLEAHPGMHDALAIRSVLSPSRMLQPSIATWAYYEMQQHDPEVALRFMTRVGGGEDLAKGMPEHTLRTRLLENLGATAKLRSPDIAFYVAKAWTSRLAGRELHLLRRVKGETFPSFTPTARANVNGAMTPDDVARLRSGIAIRL